MGEFRRKARPQKEVRACIATLDDIRDLQHAVMRWKNRAKAAEERSMSNAVDNQRLIKENQIALARAQQAEADNKLIRAKVEDWLCEKHKINALEWPDCVWCEKEKAEAALAEFKSHISDACIADLIAAEQRGHRKALEEAIEALSKRRTFTVPTTCPDGLPGCCVLHYRQEERVPITREEFIETLRALAAREVGRG